MRKAVVLAVAALLVLGGCSLAFAFRSRHEVKGTPSVGPVVGAATIEVRCRLLRCNFSDQTQTPGTPSWQWTFGDGGGSKLRNPTHLYDRPGTYTVSLVVEDLTGQQFRAIREIAADQIVVDVELQARLTSSGDKISIVGALGRTGSGCGNRLAIEEMKGGTWVDVEAVNLTKTGRFTKVLPARTGTFRAATPHTRLAKGVVCLRSESRALPYIAPAPVLPPAEPAGGDATEEVVVAGTLVVPNVVGTSAPYVSVFGVSRDFNSKQIRVVLTAKLPGGRTCNTREIYAQSPVAGTLVAPGAILTIHACDFDAA